MSYRQALNAGLLTNGSGGDVNLDGTNNFLGLNTFNTICPQSSVIPISVNDLCNKNYVDTHSGGGGGNVYLDSSNSFTALNTFNTVCPQSSVIPLSVNDLCNKNYVDSQTSDVSLSGTNAFTGLNTFNTVCPQSSVVPVNNNDLINKLYYESHGSGYIVPTIQQVLFSGNLAETDIIISDNNYITNGSGNLGLNLSGGDNSIINLYGTPIYQATPPRTNYSLLAIPAGTSQVGFSVAGSSTAVVPLNSSFTPTLLSPDIVLTAGVWSVNASFTITTSASYAVSGACYFGITNSNVSAEPYNKLQFVANKASGTLTVPFCATGNDDGTSSVRFQYECNMPSVSLTNITYNIVRIA